MKLHRLVAPVLVLAALAAVPADPAAAVTVSAAPSPAVVTQPVAVTVTADFPLVGAPSCTMEVNFGDGSPWTDAGTCTTTPCTLSGLTHVYATPGTFTLTAREKAGACLTPPNPPDPGTGTLVVNPPAVAVAVSPPAFQTARGAAASQALAYRFTATPPASLTLSSSKGVFLAGGRVVGEVRAPLSAAIRNGTAIVTEAVPVPVAVLERAERLGTPQVVYQRQFSNAFLSATALATLTLTTEAGADFRVTRIQLYFGNRRAEAEVARSGPAPKAFADVWFTGSGLLRGYWEVDGRRLAVVERHLAAERFVTLRLPDPPGLPTFQEGTHVLRFVVTEPAQEIPLPEAIYFVASGGTAGRARIVLLEPGDGGNVAASRPVFTWRAAPGCRTYLVEFLERAGEKPVFSAYTRATRYTPPAFTLGAVFRPGGRYLWHVKGFAADGTPKAESAIGTFTFGSKAEVVPGEILVAAADDAEGARVLEAVQDRYELRPVRTFRLRSIGWRCAVFRTDRDVFRLSAEIRREKGVVLAQPNYVFRTLSEPMSDLQGLGRELDFERLHRRLRGKGVLVAVIDTGVDTGHEDLRGRIRSARNLVPGEAYRAEIHGTAVAGVIAAALNGRGIEGIAPEAELLALRACRQAAPGRPEGRCVSTAVAEAVDTAVAERAGVVNLSLGATVPDPLVARVISAGARRGVVFVAPAGNVPGRGALAFPAAHPDVVAVAGRDAGGRPFPDAEIARMADLSAPCIHVLTTTPGGDYNFLDGTSLAAAAVSGVVALALGRDGRVDRGALHASAGGLCQWAERLLAMRLCRAPESRRSGTGAPATRR
ncbi:S8 family serine peptidase [Dissulfurirhabdus thermomarina]|uniref:S8 family serine peptidase n=1 Tax=Dissulfurirhabdus thermomarina TaxID=1765737 RepID=A0A6N9TPP3_DISTH|nr:S8 family serine peptidase [Dissulfurirhabdus thermomarina]NDY42410.1 S8 family serine peptidase [Dissulfurirhabdus thermomarina]NMX23820.1 S8 family serine peptidase [Dissulfurirhabdus thermomarina]